MGVRAVYGGAPERRVPQFYPTLCVMWKKRCPWWMALPIYNSNEHLRKKLNYLGLITSTKFPKFLYSLLPNLYLVPTTAGVASAAGRSEVPSSPRSFRALKQTSRLSPPLVLRVADLHSPGTPLHTYICCSMRQWQCHHARD